MIKDLILKTRSYRRFHQDQPIDEQTLRELVELATLAPSGANLQPLKYILSCEPEKNARIFPLLAWAGYLADWPGPEEGERPAAYIIILSDRKIAPGPGCDHGIAAQNIVLGAAERGIGACMIGSIERKALRKELEVSARYDVLLIVALGNPAETVVLDTAGPEGDIKYWRDEQSVHHVPKRPLDEVIIG